MAQSSSAGRLQAGQNLLKSTTKKRKPEPTRPPTILLGEHSRYQIKSGWLAGTFVARAFPKPPTKVRGMIAEATGATEEAAIAALHEVIDSRENRRIDNRRRNPKTGLAVPSTEEYVEAMRQVVLSEPQRAMLTALSLSGEDGLTDARMAYAAGYKTRTSANRSFIAAGNLIGEYLSLDTGTNEISGDPEGAAHLGYRNEPGNEGDQGHWILYAEVREAVRLAL